MLTDAVGKDKEGVAYRGAADTIKRIHAEGQSLPPFFFRPYLVSKIFHFFHF